MSEKEKQAKTEIELNPEVRELLERTNRMEEELERAIRQGRSGGRSGGSGSTSGGGSGGGY